MLQRLYVHNYRCLENFELILKDHSSALLIGKNGVGKSTILKVLELFQQVGRGVNRMKELLSFNDFARGRSNVPMRFELEVLLEGKRYSYMLAFDLPEKFKELRLLEEQFIVDGEAIYSRNGAQVTIHKSAQGGEAQFLVDWHLIALPLIFEQSDNDPLHIFRTWLAHMIIVAPIPQIMDGESSGETLIPNKDGSNFGEWFAGLLSLYPAAYAQLDSYLKGVLTDMKDILHERTGKDAKNIIIRFEVDNTTLSIDFKDLSDGEKCFFLCALVVASNNYYGPLFCFWDEPDNYLSLSEVGFFLLALRKNFQGKGQILVTSHNPEAIRKFSQENTFVLDRKSHLEPTLIRLLNELHINGDLVNALIRGDVEL